MRRIKLTVAYDGTNYCGWQVQPNGITVQEVLNKALTELLGTEIRTTGASRTDSGVHARGNVAVFETDARMPAERFAFALNTYLPPDIRIQGSEEVPSEFHPRFTSTIKTYEYKILHRTFPDPTRRLDHLFCYGKLDVEAMRRALACVVGEHDFKSFQGAGGEAFTHTTVRTIYHAEILQEPIEELRTTLHSKEQSPGPGEAEEYVLRIRITGNGFLYNMVRILAGTLLEIGRGNLREEDMTRILEARDRNEAGPTAPAHGLTLLSIRYPEWEEQKEKL
ncbi:MAG: tRNA pseudouridine(38-40) synthase TruA [Eubacterium sp.]|nr:tRNA pseudouridine(38-40) synthase TruA [Eubacterium sp.]